jgi:hypothetical protein
VNDCIHARESALLCTLFVSFLQGGIRSLRTGTVSLYCTRERKR